MTNKQLKKEIIDAIEELKEEVRKETGSFKYDDCYDDCIKIVKNTRTSNLAEAFKKEFAPEIEDHLTCGNEKCYYDGKWCYHLTDKEFDKMIKFLEEMG